MNSDAVNLVLLYIRTTDRLTYNRQRLVNTLGVNDRQVREAFYKHKDLGLTVIAYPKGCMTIVTERNYDTYREEAIAQIVRDKMIALKKLKRINKQLKSIPELDQLQIERELLEYE